MILKSVVSLGSESGVLLTIGIICTNGNHNSIVYERTQGSCGPEFVGAILVK